ncbi:MAG: bifunctional phosphoribosyl-AMP cyclohydrolase/phosphoribosyl-ATP diphosphatase HisIE [Candidatus Caldatribacterium sp.]|nr:bifunctional phosphoribosyl-AMP cyclohydrolase/phosphoribosyl-ATP diphosphatase HisIE [Candidatus Caldatribacterium sp.]
MELRFDEKGLIPAVVQDAETGKVLMVAYMNEEALRRTLETKTTWFYSRSRGKLWNKGETSGHIQHVEGIYVDCDNDCLLVTVRQEGVACHTGFFSCFHRELEDGKPGEPKNGNPPFPLFAFLGELFEVIKERAQNPSPSSYTAKLLAEGKEKILRKVAEEATEVLLAAFEEEVTRKDHLRYEVADLLYHLLVLLKHEGLSFGEVMEELKKRHVKRP